MNATAVLPKPRVALKAFLGVAEAWQLNRTEQLGLLRISPRTFDRWRSEPDKANFSHDTLERISYLIGIYAGSHAVFTDSGYADRWIRDVNEAFGAQSPLQRMLAGNISDLLIVRQYIDRAQYAW